ncbi:MAG: hypothetical protein LC746_01535 [Acidobacteria bacterium]|nr:hypothetical protein [Acidobacteriota bacterium]
MNSQPNGSQAPAQQPPHLALDAERRIEPASLGDIIQWFLDRDPRVGVVRHTRVEEVFQWKQRAAREAGEEVFEFARAEDRFAVGVMQALMRNQSEGELHDWIGQLLNALDDATRTNEEIARAYRLADGDSSRVAESEKIPTASGREVYLTCCWLEALCTAEVRVLGWLYQELYGRPFHPDNFTRA